MPLSPLPHDMLEPLVHLALAEDLGRAGDITTDAIIPAAQQGRAQIVARKAGVIAGMECARLAFQLLDSGVRFTAKKNDSDTVQAGEALAVVEGPMRAILTGERVALNFLGHLSGIATATRSLVDAVKPHNTRVACTRKTTPGLRALEKYAVRAGGGFNHRMGLDDATLIKANHIAAAGNIRTAVEKSRAAAGHLVKIELEVDTLDQLRDALNLSIDAVLLDNMDAAMLTQAVKMVNGKFTTEASGNVTPANIGAIAATGVDVISSGWITHSAPVLDLALDYSAA